MIYTPTKLSYNPESYAYEYHVLSEDYDRSPLDEANLDSNINVRRDNVTGMTIISVGGTWFETLANLIIKAHYGYGAPTPLAANLVKGVFQGGANLPLGISCYKLWSEVMNPKLTEAERNTLIGDSIINSVIAGTSTAVGLKTAAVVGAVFGIGFVVICAGLVLSNSHFTSAQALLVSYEIGRAKAQIQAN